VPLVVYGGFLATMGSSKPGARVWDVVRCVVR
jgi:hypothetical protein